MNSASSDSAHRDAGGAAARPTDDAVVRGADMPDVIRPSPAADPHNSASAAPSSCHVCQVASRRHASAYDSSSAASSSSSAAAAAGYHVIYGSRDNAENAECALQAGVAVAEPLPDLVNVHRPPASSPPTPVICHAATVSHYIRQPHASSTIHSSAHHLVRGIKYSYKLPICFIAK